MFNQKLKALKAEMLREGHSALKEASAHTSSTPVSEALFKLAASLRTNSGCPRITYEDVGLLSREGF